MTILRKKRPPNRIQNCYYLKHTQFFNFQFMRNFSQTLQKTQSVPYKGDFRGRKRPDWLREELFWKSEASELGYKKCSPEVLGDVNLMAD